MKKKIMKSEGVRVQPIYEFKTLKPYIIFIFIFLKVSDDSFS